MAELKDRYAAAVFDLYLESDAPELAAPQAALVLDVLENERLGELLVHPHVPDAAKVQLLHDLFADKISGALMGFLRLAVARSRENLIGPSLSVLIDMANRHSGMTDALVVSAAPLGEGQLSALGALLSEKLGKQVRVEARSDPALIGGLYIHVDGRLIDRSVRTRLRNMKDSLKRGGVK